MECKYRSRYALLSYLCIQVFWGLLVVLTPVAAAIHPTKLWAIPFGLVTMAGGVHLTYFRYEYNALVERIVSASPLLRYIVPGRYNPEYYLPVGIVYTLLGVISVILVVRPLDFTPLLQHLL